MILLRLKKKRGIRFLYLFPYHCTISKFHSASGGGEGACAKCEATQGCLLSKCDRIMMGMSGLKQAILAWHNY